MGTTSGSIWRMACAAASPPVSTCSCSNSSTGLLLHHRDRADRARLGAQLASLAVTKVETRERRTVDSHRGVRAVQPAEQAVHALRKVALRHDAGAPAAGLRLLGLVAQNDPTGMRHRANSF